MQMFFLGRKPQIIGTNKNEVDSSGNFTKTVEQQPTGFGIFDFIDLNRIE